MSIRMPPEGRRLLEECRRSELPSSEQIYRIAQGGAGFEARPVRRRLHSRDQVGKFIGGIALLLLIGGGAGVLITLARGIWP